MTAGDPPPQDARSTTPSAHHGTLAATLQRIPLVQSLQGYTPKAFGADLTAAILITAAAVPLGIGFATTAGLPPITGLYSSVMTLIVFGLVSSSRHVKLGFDAMAAVLIGSTIVPLAMVNGQVDNAKLGSLVAILALLTGAILFLAGLARFGLLADLLSVSLLLGYQAGIALNVIIGQLPKMLGYKISGDTDVEKAIAVVKHLGETHWPTLVAGFGTWAALILLRRLWPGLPGAIVILIAAIAVSAVTHLDRHGVAVVGTLPKGLPTFGLPDFQLAQDNLGLLLGTAASLALVLAADTIIPSRAFASRGHYRVSANQDMAALGLAQMASAVSGGVTASASYARTAISARVGSKTQLSAVMGGLLMALLCATATGLLASLPVAVLGAICADAVSRLIELKTLRGLWQMRKREALLAVATCLLVLSTDPLLAIGVAVGASLVFYLAKAARPRQSLLGHRPGMTGWYPVNAFPDAAEVAPTISVFRWTAPLVFVNANTFRTKARAAARGRAWLLVDCTGMFDLDPSAIESVDGLLDDLADTGTQLAFSGPNPDVARMLRVSGLAARLGEDPHVFVNLDTAVAALTDPSQAAGTLRDDDGDGVWEYVATPGA
ncbi:MAG: STAS domain-containing protein [Bifidobacteriaceae bacterium]|jgi:high affinity sulfate transporter 1|nr:STAS domain-containing protein [Bifidobacteriaceae bacterium]